MNIIPPFSFLPSKRSPEEMVKPSTTPGDNSEKLRSHNSEADQNTANVKETSTSDTGKESKNTLNDTIAIISVIPPIQNALNQSPAQPARFVVLKPPEEEDVNEEFVKTFNTHYGNMENEEKAKRLLDKMRKLGGLSSPNLDKNAVNIISARDGLCVLAGLKKNKFKKEAISLLIRILEKDPINKDSAENLVSLAIELTKKMDPFLIQTEVLDIQIKICRAYGLVAELIQRHFSAGHINAITNELKKQFRSTFNRFSILNVLEDPHLAFAIGYSLEGIKRIKDDNRELLEMFERFTHLTTSLGNLYNIDLEKFYQELFTTFKDLNNRCENAWYNAVMIMNNYQKGLNEKPENLLGIQILLKDKFKDYNWKFVYAGMKILTYAVIHCENPQVRQAAFEGQKLSSSEYPGLLFFMNFRQLPRTPNFAPLIHFKPPKLEDYNRIVRQVFVENLEKISRLSPDAPIRLKAKEALINSLVKETDEEIIQYLRETIPSSLSEQKEWLSEQGKYAHAVVFASEDHGFVNRRESKKNILGKKLDALKIKAFEEQDTLLLTAPTLKRNFSLPNLKHAI